CALPIYFPYSCQNFSRIGFVNRFGEYAGAGVFPLCGNQFPCLARTHRRRDQREIGEPAPSRHFPAHEWSGPPAAVGERALEIAERWVVPARFRMPQEKQLAHPLQGVKRASASRSTS